MQQLNCNHEYPTKEVSGVGYVDKDGYTHIPVKIRCTGCGHTIGCRVEQTGVSRIAMPYYGYYGPIVPVRK